LIKKGKKYTAGGKKAKQTRDQCFIVLAKKPNQNICSLPLMRMFQFNVNVCTFQVSFILRSHIVPPQNTS